MSFPLIDIAQARIRDRISGFLAGFQGPVSRVQGYRMQSFSQPHKRAVALFGADYGFGEDYVSYRSAKPAGPATTPQPLQNELKEVDADASLESWVPDPSRPSLTSHGRKLDYSHMTDQKPPVGHSVTPGDVWDGVVRNTTKRPDFQVVRGKSEPTVGDQHAIDLKTKYPFDFSN